MEAESNDEPLAWLRDVGMPSLGRAAAAAAKPVPQLVPRIKAHLLAEPAGGGRPLRVGTLDQIVDDLVALAGLGAVEVVLRILVRAGVLLRREAGRAGRASRADRSHLS